MRSLSIINARGLPARGRLGLGRRALHAILGYEATNSGTGFTDTTAVNTGLGDFSARNGHWIFTESYDLVAAFAAGATLTGSQFFDATYNATNIPQIYPPNLSLVPLTNPNILDLRAQPWPIPQNEEFALQNNASSAVATYGLIWIVPSGTQPWLTQPPMPSVGSPRVYAAVTATMVLTATAWSPPVVIAFTNTLKGGAYQVNGAYFVVAQALAYRFTFPKFGFYGIRKLSPGGLVENAYGNVPNKLGRDWMGIQGVFNYFEPFQVSVLATGTVGSATYNGFLDMTYLGNTFQAGQIPGG